MFHAPLGPTSWSSLPKGGPQLPLQPQPLGSCLVLHVLVSAHTCASCALGFYRARDSCLFAVLQEHASLLRSFSHTQAQEAMLCSSQALQALSPSACLSTQTQPYVWPVLPQLHLQSPPAVPVAAVPMAAYDLQRALGTCLLMRPREKRFILSLFTIKDQGDTHFIWRFQSEQSS